MGPARHVGGSCLYRATRLRKQAQAALNDAGNVLSEVRAAYDRLMPNFQQSDDRPRPH